MLLALSLQYFMEMAVTLQAVYFRALEALDRFTYYVEQTGDPHLESLVGELTVVIGTAYALKDLATLEDAELSCLTCGDELERKLASLD